MEFKPCNSPTLKHTDHPVRPRSFVFSPINEENSSSYSATPRRKLCLDSLDDSSQSPSTFSDSSSSTDTRSPSTESFTLSSSANLTEEWSAGKHHLYSRRQRHSLILPGKENVPENSRTILTKSRNLVSLPASPLTANDVRFCSLLKQINSPLERMNIHSSSPTPPISCTSEHSNESDGYFSEVFDQDVTSDENSNSSIPDSISSLLTKPFTEHHQQQLCDAVRKKSTPVNNCRTRHVSLRGCLKRPTPTDKDLLPGERLPKKPPLMESGNSPTSRKPMKSTTLFRSQSLSVPPCENTLYPISPGEGGVERIGDHSKPYLLPLMKEPSVADQKNITPATLARLMKNDFVDLVDEYTVIDCRYPYEFDGGHIRDAINIWEKEKMVQHFFASPRHPDANDKRRIIIFHCEFSSKRGPEMSRYMRKIDRERNGMDFPKLFYPEIYLLNGGYKNFYASNPQLCEPKSYKCMLDENHKDDLKHFSKRSKSFNEHSTVSRRSKQTLRHRHSAHEVKSMSTWEYKP